MCALLFAHGLESHSLAKQGLSLVSFDFAASGFRGSASLASFGGLGSPALAWRRSLALAAALELPELRAAEEPVDEAGQAALFSPRHTPTLPRPLRRLPRLQAD